MTLLKFLCKLWSLSPLCALTRDANYGYNDKCFKEGLRFSLINVMLGNRTFYLLTIAHEQDKLRFKIWFKLTLDNCQWESEKHELPLAKKSECFNNLAKKYIEEHIKQLGPKKQCNDIDLEKEFLGYMQQNNQKRLDTSFNKMNFYTAIILVLLPLLYPALKVILPKILDSPSLAQLNIYILLILLGYMLLNWMLLVLQYMSVTGIEKSRFSQIREPENGYSRKQQLLFNYYFDWQMGKNHTNLCVAYVANTENFVKWSVAFFSLMILLTLSVTAFWESPSTPQSSEANVYLVNLDNLDNPYSSDNLTLDKLQIAIRECQPHILTIIISQDCDTDLEARVYTMFEQYSSVIEIHFYRDPYFEDNMLKVFIGGMSQ